jgi:hypothetical protein
MDDLQPADLACAAPVEPICEPQPLPWQAALCGHTPEDFAAVALALEPRGAAWCKDFGTIKAALYRGFGKLLSDFEQRMCALFKESLACESVELLGEWEFEYGLPGECAVGSYPTDLAGRQAMVCAARRAQGISTMKELEDILKIALDCPHLTLEDFYEHNWVNTHVGMPLTVYAGICVRGIGPVAPVPYVHNVVGGWGTHPAISTGVYGSATGQPLTLVDPNYTAPEQCPIVYHSTVGGWTGGVGIPLTTADPVKWALLVCLMQKHLPAQAVWRVCVPE